MSLRPLTLAAGGAEHVLLVPTALYASSTELRDQFVRALGEDIEVATAAELVALFLEWVARHDAQDVLPVVLNEFETRFLADTDVHTLAAGVDDPAQLVRAYVLARETASEGSDKVEAAEKAPATASALLQAAQDGKAKVHVVFGGQGTSEDYFDELRTLYDVYGDLVRTLIEDSTRFLGELVAATPEAAKVYAEWGLDVVQWLQSGNEPPKDYLVSAPVSVPVIGLIQFTHYQVACLMMGLTPGELRSRLAGASGHSQGIVTALAVASANSWADWSKQVRRALGTLFFIGLRCQLVYPETALAPAVLRDAEAAGEGRVSPMLSVRDVGRADLDKFIEQTNAFLPADKRLRVSLVNGPRGFVVSGPPMSLVGLNRALRAAKAAPGEAEGRVPHSQRKLKLTNRFLRVTTPFHCGLLASATSTIQKDVARFKEESVPLGMPVYDTFDGHDLAADGQEAWDRVVELITELPVHWETATRFAGSTHIVDFGPGGAAGLALLTHRNKEGSGVRVIAAGEFALPPNSELGAKYELFGGGAVKYASNWAAECGPRLVRWGERLVVDTKMSRLLGRPPVMVPGMTPSTVQPEVVAEILNAGYHVELGGGGYFRESQLQAALERLPTLVTGHNGSGITLNVLYVNPAMLQWCIPMVRRLRAAGVPLEGLTVGAGVPSVEVANEWISTLGIKHLGLKPGTVESIRQCAAIAGANPDFPIMVQWTGGRGGGHHSFEDFHAPILATYAQLRRHSNIVLVAGSGFGDADGTYPYLTGQWSAEFGYPPMPFDGFLFGSRTMVAREMRTASDAKQAIVAAPGVANAEWERTYRGVAGGVVTVRSEMGEPIHKLATRGVLLWKELDETVLSLPRNQRVAALAKQKSSLVRRLNADYQKVWFPRKTAQPERVVDVEDMTYLEIVQRLVELMYVADEERWIDRTLRDMTAKFIGRLEERLAGKPRDSVLQTPTQLDAPSAVLELIEREYPASATQLVTAHDKDFFLALCLERTHKPVPFVPALDENFEFWFKKDSLWQSEDLAAVPGRDVGRTCILQGPVAASFSHKVDEPVADILGSVHEGHVARLVADKYDGDASKVPRVETLGLPAVFSGELAGVLMSQPDSATRRLELAPSTPASALPPAKAWRAAVAGGDGWLHALLASPHIAQGHLHVPNALWRVVAPVAGMRVDVGADSVVVHEGGVKTVEISHRAGDVTVLLWEHRTVTGSPVALDLRFVYAPQTLGGVPVREVLEGRHERIKRFYWALWFGAEPYAPPAVESEWTTPAVSVTDSEVRDFAHAVGNNGEAYVRGHEAPLDYAIVAGWQAVTRGIFPVDGDLLRLVHLGNRFEMRPGAEPLRAGDRVHAVARINSVAITKAGKTVDVRGTLYRGAEPVVDVSSQFLYRGSFTDYDSTFAVRDETPTELVLATPKDVAVLRAKEWFHPVGEPELLGKTVQVRCVTRTRSRSADVFEHVETSGVVVHVLPTKEAVEVGHVAYEAGRGRGNPVTEYLSRVGTPIEQAAPFERAIPLASKLEVRAPASNEAYARVSGDRNPIHVSRSLAALAALPGTIVHGMWTSAAARALVEQWAAASAGKRVRAWNAEFVGMVLPHDVLRASLEHVGMINGRMLVKAVVTRVATPAEDAENLQDGQDVEEETVLVGEAEVAQPRTAYFFTGQGSQEQGMGMELYAASAVARQVWDRADRHFVSTYGISILDIVRNNPRELTVHFGGEQGRRIRDNYRAMHFETANDDGTTHLTPIFASIGPDTDSYTFTSPTGVLAMTQFTQPALTLMEKAALEDMKARGLVDAESAFAGHSLGEYSALAAMADVMPVESLVDVVFYRGMTMQVAVPRDSRGRSNYGMVAVNPSRVSRSFSDAQLREVVAKVAQETGWLLEIVNFNVANQQYVAAGDLRALDSLSTVLDATKAQGRVPEGIIAQAAAAASAKPQPIALTRGQACIPLPGISVPFHSSYLRSGVTPFKTFLAKRVAKNAVKPAALVGKYIPNLTAKPFEVTKEYFEEVYGLTQSSQIRDILERWDEITRD